MERNIRCGIREVNGVNEGWIQLPGNSNKIKIDLLVTVLKNDPRRAKSIIGFAIEYRIKSEDSVLGVEGNIKKTFNDIVSIIS